MGRGSNAAQEAVIKTIKKKCKKAKWLSEEGLQTVEKRREAKGKGEKERYIHLNAEFQRIARRDKKAFLSEHCKEISSVQSLSTVWLFMTPWTAAHQVSLYITNTQSLPRLISIESVMPSNHLILCHPLLLQSFPASRSFQMSSLFASCGQRIGFQLQHQSFQWTPRTDLL